MNKKHLFLSICGGVVIFLSALADDKTVASYVIGDYARYLPSSKSIGNLADKAQGWAKVAVQAAQDPRAQNAGILAGKSEQEARAYAQSIADRAKQIQALAGYVGDAAAINQDPLSWGLNKSGNALLDTIAPSVFKDIDEAVKQQIFVSLKDRTGYDLRQLYEYLVATGMIKGFSSKDPSKWMIKNWVTPQLKKLILKNLGLVPSFSDMKKYVTGLWVSSNVPQGQKVAIEKEGADGEQIEVFTSKGTISDEEQKILDEMLKKVPDWQV